MIILLEGTSNEIATNRSNIGFSRGAYTTRVLAGFLHAFGLIESRNLNLPDYAYRAYKRIGKASAKNAFLGSGKIGDYA